jgi:quercetin dioxygenase-like cupin family protein
MVHVKKEAVRAKGGRLGQMGDQKVLVAHPSPLDETWEAVNAPPAIVWEAVTSDNRFPVQVTDSLELAVFDERAKQDRHIHKLGTAIYTVLDGYMRIEVDGIGYVLAAGDTIVVNPWAAHRVKPDSPFIAQVITANCGGSADRFPEP